MFQYKASFNYDATVIVGNEHVTRAAKKEFLLNVKELQEYTSKEEEIEYRVHLNPFPPRGNVTAEVKNKFNVVLHFPLHKKSKKVTVTGIRVKVENAVKHLQMLTEYFMVDAL